MTDKKVLLVLPNESWEGKRPWLAIPHAVLILTRLLKPICDFSILDANAHNLTKAETAQRMAASTPDIILISAASCEYAPQYHTVARLANETLPRATVVMGGVYPTVLPDEVIADENIDYIFLGHAEERIHEFMGLLLNGADKIIRQLDGVGFRSSDGQPVSRPHKSFIGEVRELVRPDYSVIDIEPYLVMNSLNYQTNAQEKSAQIITSYGCAYNCVFCASRTISGRKVAYRPVDDVIEEIDYLYRERGVTQLVFMDDNFLGDKPRMRSILNTFIKRGYDLKWKVATVAAWHLDDTILEEMKQAGCVQITISVESGSKRVLRDIIHKPIRLDTIKPIVDKCRELKIDIGANFVIGFPGETWEEIRESFSFAESCDFDVVHFHIATPFPKTDLYRLAKKKNCLPEDFSFLNPKYFGMAYGFITTDEFTPEELMILRAYEYDRINFKTPEKTAKVAALYCTSVEELNRHRRETRRKIGIHF